MGIFSRRNISRMLAENSRFVGRRQLSEHISRLNGNDEVQRVTTEWELAVVNGLSKIGTAVHEPSVPGTSKPDVLFTCPVGTALLDITTVSDRGLDLQNPIHKLANRLLALVRARGLEPRHFGIRARGNSRDLRIGGPKARLFIPRERDFDRAVFDEEFNQFIAEIRDSPKAKRDLSIAKSDVQVTITYEPAQEFFSLNHLSYTVPFSANENAIWRALEEKTSQLKLSEFNGIKAVILCDGGCDALNRWGRNGIDFDADDIVHRFLAANGKIEFVLALLVNSDGSLRSAPENLRIVAKTWVSSGNGPGVRLANYLHETLPTQFPNPENSPFSAYGISDEGKSFNGGGIMSSRSIKISSRAVANLFAGRTTQHDFMRDNPHVKDYFARAIAQGRMLSGTRIESCPNRDDDWIEFEFSGPDPAISRFRKPREQTGI